MINVEGSASMQCCKIWKEKSPIDVGTDMSSRRAVPQVSYLTQVLGQVVLMVGLGSQLQVAAEWVQPHWISPAETSAFTCIPE